MKLTVERADLLQVIGIAERGVNPKSPMPIYGSLMLEVAQDELRVTGTDGEVTLTAVCPVLTPAAGKVAVLAANFSAIVKGMGEGPFTLSAQKGALSISNGQSRYRVALVTGEAWPPLPTVTETAGFTVTVPQLAAGLGRVLPAIGADTTRPVLCGSYWESGAAGLTLVSTDTLRLHLARVEQEGQGAATHFILGGSATRQLLRVLEGEGECHVMTDGATVRVEGPWGVFLGALIAGEYLEYHHFITPPTSWATFERVPFTSAVRRAAYVAQGCADRLVLAPAASSTATLSAASENYGEGEETVTLHTDAPFEAVAVSSRYLSQALAGFSGERVRLCRCQRHRGILVDDPEAPEYFAVVMPMRLPHEE